MVFYICTYIFSLFSCYVAESVSFKQQNIKIVFYIIAALIPCVLASIRADTVGTDVLVYVVPQYDEAKNFESIFCYVSNSPIEIFPSVITYIVSKFELGIHWILFSYQLLTIGPLMLLGYKKRNLLSVTFLLFIYLFLLFPVSLNIMRQSVASSFVLLGFVYLQEMKHTNWIICSVLAILMHKTSLLLIVVLKIIKIINNSRYYKYIILIGILCGMVSSIYIKEICYFINGLGVFPETYFNRLLLHSGEDGKRLSVLVFLFNAIFIILPAMVLRRKHYSDKDYYIIPLIGFSFLVMGFSIQYLLRVFLYFQYFYLLGVPIFFKLIKNLFERKFAYGLIGIGLIFYWYIVFVEWGYHGVTPFIIRCP